MTPAEAFRGRLLSEPVTALDAFTEREVLNGRPFIFPDEAEWIAFRSHVLTLLEVIDPSTEVIVVGSAKTGFSLKPTTFAQPFRESSDIDLVVVNTSLFDSAWQGLLAWDYLTKGGRTRAENDWLTERRTQTFRGWYDPTHWRRQFDSVIPAYPHRLRPLRDQGFRWFAAFQSLSRYKGTPEVAKHSVKARLYRTREHAHSYHVQGLRLLHEQLGGGVHAI